MTTENNNDAVITTSYSQNRTVYHTTVCRMVWEIGKKRYPSEADAERMGLSECAYCADEYTEAVGDRSLYNKLVQMGEANAD